VSNIPQGALFGSKHGGWRAQSRRARIFYRKNIGHNSGFRGGWHKDRHLRGEQVKYKMSKGKDVKAIGKNAGGRIPKALAEGIF